MADAAFKTIRQFVRCLSVAAILFIVPGCWDRTELNDLALINALGVDLAEDGQIEVTGQQIIPQSSGGGNQMGGGGKKENKQTVVRKGKGETLADALSNMEEVIGRKIFLGHAEVVVFGERLARNGIRESVDFLVRNPQLRTRTLVYVSKGSPDAILSTVPKVELSSAKSLRLLSDKQLYLVVDLNHLTQMLASESRSAALPTVETREPNTIIISGTAIFDEDKLVGQLDRQASRGLLWIRNEMKKAVITVRVPRIKGDVSLQVIHSKTETVPRIERGKWKLAVKIRTDADLRENGTLLSMSTPWPIDQIERQADQTLKQRVQLAQKKVQEMGIDVFGFANAFHRKYPKEWAKVKDHWKEKFPQVQVDIQTQVHVRRTGMTNQPVGVPKERVRSR
jgi:spore germination protein KC